MNVVKCLLLRRSDVRVPITKKINIGIIIFKSPRLGSNVLESST